MDTLALIQGQKSVETTVRLSNFENNNSPVLKMTAAMDRLAINQGKDIVEATIRISKLEND